VNIIELRPDTHADPRLAPPGLFLAGGITGAPDWQRTVLNDLVYRSGLHPYRSLVIYNPRRPDFDVSRAESSIEQIRWENLALLSSKVILFWFPKEAACQITLLELGRFATMGRRIAVGVEPGYKRELDVREQLGHMRPEIAVMSRLESTVSRGLTLMELEW